MRAIIPALIFLIVTWKFSGINAPRIHDWSIGREKRVLSLFFKTLPADDEQEARMEDSWSLKSPGSKNFSYKELQHTAYKLIEENYKKWQARPIAEREKLIERFSNALATIREPRIEDSNKIADILIKAHEDYRRERTIFRSVVYKLFEERVLQRTLSIWTPQDKALLWYVFKALKIENEDFKDKIESRWAQLNPDWNVRGLNLMDKMKELEDEKYRPNTREAAEAKKRYHEVLSRGPDNLNSKEPRKWTGRWPEERNAELLYVYEQYNRADRELYRDLEGRWAQIYGYPSPVAGESLMKRVKILQRENYKPSPEHMKLAKAKYEKLPPLNAPDRKGKGILNEPGPRKELTINIASTRHSSEQCHLDGNTFPYQRRTGKGIQISDELGLRKELGVDIASTSRSREQHERTVPGYIATPRVGAGHGTQRQHMDLDLNQPFKEFDLNEPYHHWEHGDSSGH